ncbi:hypothetical protein LEP1GSC120_3141 [Leptospira santarosai str. 200702252]|nr:hypothetical protein LEP1GSC130_3705 [Leptospira santarosai str. 200403458]EMO97813.1 hypothetical protein LEP1GSC120_3141 [Leptospira santarosai str. 200702252]
MNHFLHIFGWALIFEIRDNKVISVSPARVKYRGFPETATEEAFKKITKHLRDSVEDLVKDVE